MRPIVELQIWDFVAMTRTKSSTRRRRIRYMLRQGGPTVPLVIRGPRRPASLAAQHSQSLEAWFAHVPGLVVMAPLDAYDAKGSWPRHP